MNRLRTQKDGVSSKRFSLDLNQYAKQRNNELSKIQTSGTFSNKQDMQQLHNHHLFSEGGRDDSIPQISKIKILDPLATSPIQLMRKNAKRLVFASDKFVMTP